MLNKIRQREMLKVSKIKYEKELFLQSIFAVKLVDIFLRGLPESPPSSFFVSLVKSFLLLFVVFVSIIVRLFYLQISDFQVSSLTKK